MILERMAAKIGVPVEYIEQIARSANHRYKVYRIAKRTGGTREIAHPSAELKGLQRWLAENVLGKFLVHDKVFSYRRGLGIREHAELHKRQNYLVRVDLKDFFPSISALDVAQLIRGNLHRLPTGITTHDLRNICWLVCRHGGLTIGAPSSPAISNAVLYDFDKKWASLCKKVEVEYSRYADDIYLSTNRPDTLAKLIALIREDLGARKWPRLQINARKTVYTSRKHNRNVTGLILTSDRRVSIGHKKKRWVRSQIYKFTQGVLIPEEISYLRGYLAYVRSVEIGLLGRLRKKYGADVIRSIENAPVATRKTVKMRKKKRLGMRARKVAD